jgi:hypothetical protein
MRGGSLEVPQVDGRDLAGRQPPQRIGAGHLADVRKLELDGRRRELSVSVACSTYSLR